MSSTQRNGIEGTGKSDVVVNGMNTNAGGKRLLHRTSSGLGYLNRRKMEENNNRVVGDQYQLGSEIGRGGFAIVFAALDLHNGRSVAIKQVSLQNVGNEDMVSIESEIHLLRKLNHENIVKYIDTIKTQEYLYIVLEYMENGSLARFMKNFGGSLSETLVAMYISQVLQGLAYLHEQGVLHRDVKAANILTTKDGIVKLADFGVATRLNESQKSNSVVGSPYWMAPEVIEMEGWTFASDIWSVGCTIIELVSTKPPYYDLTPMAALFRIVQDDHPPLPDFISPALQDFIMKCFMKEPCLRASAYDLLSHPWITSIPKIKVQQSSQLVNENVSSSHHRDAMLKTIQLYEEGKDQNNMKIKSQRTSNNSSIGEKEEDADEDNWDDEFSINVESIPLHLPQSSSFKSLSSNKISKFEDDSNGFSSAFKLSAEDQRALMSDDMWDEDNGSQNPIHLANLNKISDNYTVGKKSSHALVKSRMSSWGEGSSFRHIERSLSKLKTFSEVDDDTNFIEEIDEVALVNAFNTKQMNLAPQNSANGLRLAREATLDSETAEVDFTAVSSTDYPESLFADELVFENAVPQPASQKVQRVVELLGSLDPQNNERKILDACSEIENLLSTSPTAFSELIGQPSAASNLMEALEIKPPKALYAVLRVIRLIMEGNQKFQENMALVGLVPAVIRLISGEKLSLDSEHWIEDMDAYAEEQLNESLRYSIRLEAAKFARQICTTSQLTLQIFVACGGLPVLVALFSTEKNYPAKQRVSLIRIALDGFVSIFTLQTIPKNDICRLFVKAGLFRPFINIYYEMSSIVYDVDSNNRLWEIEDLNRMCDILLFFSQGDTVVKEHMCKDQVLKKLLETLLFVSSSSSDHLHSPKVKVLKCIRNLSMDLSTLNQLDRTGAIVTLIKLLKMGAQSKDVEDVTLQTMFYLCRIDRTRQTRAAEAGVIPLLMDVIQRSSLLKQFAIPILCDFAHASQLSREKLWRSNSANLFLDLLADKYWQSGAIKSISVWLAHDVNTRLDRLLQEPKNIMRLIACFSNAKFNEIENLLEPLVDIVTRSNEIGQLLVQSALFVNKILQVLEVLPKKKAYLQKPLLKLLKVLLECHKQPSQFVIEFQLYPYMHNLVQNENNMVIVKEIALQILQKITEVVDVM